MECIVAYALLALFTDLLHEIVSADVAGEDAQWIDRQLWSDTYCDCRTVMPDARLLAGSRPAAVKPFRHKTCPGQARNLELARLAWKPAGPC